MVPAWRTYGSQYCALFLLLELRQLSIKIKTPPADPFDLFDLFDLFDWWRRVVFNSFGHWFSSALVEFHPLFRSIAPRLSCSRNLLDVHAHADTTVYQSDWFFQKKKKIFFFNYYHFNSIPLIFFFSRFKIFFFFKISISLVRVIDLSFEFYSIVELLLNWSTVS